jgi:hypothetical protein
MSVDEFDGFFERGQRWLAAHGRPHEASGTSSPAAGSPGAGKQGGNGATLDITRTYVKQQARSRFIVMGA